MTTTTTTTRRPRATKAKARRPRRINALAATAPARRHARRNRILRPTGTPISTSTVPKSPLWDKILMNDTDAHPHLWLTHDTLDLRFSELLQCVRSRFMLKEITIYNIWSAFTKQEIEVLYNTIAESLTQLETLNVWASSTPMSVAVLVSVLDKAPRLVSVVVNQVEIHTLQEMTLLCTAIAHHPSLQRFALDNVRLMEGSLLTLDPLLETIANKSSMASLRISTDHHHNNNNKMIGNATCLVHLCQSLQELCLWGIALTDDTVQQMARALSEQPPPQRSRRFQRLRTLTLRYCGPQLTDKGYDALVHMLQRNHCLETISLDGGTHQHKDSDNNLTNTTPTTATQVMTAGPSPHIQWKLDFYLHLNRSGVRQALLENPNASRSAWMEALAMHNQDLNALFYLLQESGSTLFVSSSS